MIRIPAATIGALGLALLVSGGCGFHRRVAAPVDKPVFRSARRPPDWITSRPSLPDTLVSVGIATGATSLEAGQTAAVRAAVSDIVTYLGIRAEVLFTQTESKLTTEVTSQITARGAGRIASGRTVEMYFEKHEQFRSGIRVESYDVYVLVAIPIDELESERRRIELEAQARRVHAERLFEEGEQAKNVGNFEGALLRWLNLLEILQDEEEASALAQQVRFELFRLVDELQLQFEPPEKHPPEHLAVSARLGDAALPVVGLPIRFSFSRGGGTDQRTRTDDNGLARVDVPNAARTGAPLVVRAALDSDRVLGAHALSLGAAEKPLGGLLAKLDTLHAKTVAPRSDSQTEDSDRPGWVSADVRPRTPRWVADEAVKPALATVPGPIEVSLLAGNEYIYTQRGRPEHCAAFLLELTAPASLTSDRPPLNLALVLDRSGSMKPARKLTYLKMAAKLLVANLRPYDVFSLVTYSDEAIPVIPAGTISDPTMADHMIDMLRASGTTNLGEGLIRGIEQVKAHHAGSVSSRVILVSDGLANEGITDPSVLGSYAAHAANKGISLTTIGLGDEFDEDLLMALANEGYGRYYYVKDADEIPRVLSDELQGLLTLAVREVRAELILDPGVGFVDSLGSHYRWENGRVIFPLGNLAAGERARVAFELELPLGPPGRVHLGSMVVSFHDVTAPGAREQRSLQLRAVYTEDHQEAEASARMEVNRFVHVLAIMNSMLEAKRSRNVAAIDEVLKYIESELPRLSAWSYEKDDPEMQELIRMLKHCSMILRAERRDATGAYSTRRSDVAKELSYRLYRLRHHPVWETD